MGIKLGHRGMTGGRGQHDNRLQRRRRGGEEKGRLGWVGGWNDEVVD